MSAQRVFTKTILPDKLHSELAHIQIYNGLYQTEGDGVINTFVNLTEDPSNTIDQEINAIVNAHVPTPIRHKIEDYIEATFVDYPIYKIDFTLHLIKNTVLAKSVYKALNGRPERAEYTLDSVPMAKIRWEFTDAPGGLYQDKKLYLSYYLENGDQGEEFLIEHEIIDFTIPNQLEKSIKERVIARGAIVGEIKAVCSGALQIGLGKTLEQVITTIKPFWDATKLDRDNFVELATHDWMNAVAGIDTTVDYGWLSTPVDANGTTCQQYMLYRLGY